MPKTSFQTKRADLSRTGFDMSQSLAFTASTGMILPVYSDLLNAGETVYYSSDLFARTQPLVTAAMADVDIYLDWFFVPCTMLLTTWGQTRYQTNDFISSLFYDGDDGSLGIPNTGASGQGFGGFPLLSAVSYGSPASPTSDTWNLPAVFSLNPTLSSEGIPSALTYPTNLAYGFETSFKSMFRMLDLLGFNPYGIFQNTAQSGISGNPDVFPWRALAYQCIYQNYYRNDDYEVRDVCSYNWDKYMASTSAVDLGPASTNMHPQNPFILRYCDYRRDYFTSIRPSAITSTINSFGSPSSGGLSGNASLAGILASVNNYLSNINVPLASANSTYITTAAISNGGSLTQVGSTLPVAGDSSKVLTANLRSLFAVEKLLRVTGSAAKDYDSQVLAHFGFKVPHDVKHQITHLHSSQGLLHIGEVISTSDTSGSSGAALGEIAGKGYVSIHDKGHRKFTAPVDGIVMCNFRAVPRMRTYGTFDKQNAVTDRLSLYIPEFDKLGAQPLYYYEFSRATLGNSTASAQVGWQNRYEQFKRKYDRVSVVFEPNSGVGNQNPDGSINQYAPWVLSYSPFNGLVIGSTPLGFNTGMYLKCPPTALNNIMTVPYNPRVDGPSFNTSNVISEFYTDPFICDFRANVKKVSTMSRSGEPDLVSL